MADYDSYSAVIRSFLKETVRAYRQFAASHPGESSPSMCPAPRTRAGAPYNMQTRFKLSPTPPTERHKCT